MKVLISGASGLIGTAFAEEIEANGVTPVKLVRDRSKLTDTNALWEPEHGVIDIPKLDWIAGTEGFRAVVNLAGENIAMGKWTDEYKIRIRDSRIKSTTLLAESLSKFKVKPPVLVNASAIGYYGNRGDELLDEHSSPGTNGFLTALAKDWEDATKPASEAGIRTILARFGIVLSAKGGALKKMISMAKIGGAAPVGEGNQWWSWITIDDAVRAIVHCIRTESISGPVNIVNTNPMKNLDFSQSMQVYFKAPVHMHVPAFMLKMTMGEMAEEMLLASQMVSPLKLRQTGFKFRHTHLEAALRHLTSTRVVDIDKELGP